MKKYIAIAFCLGTCIVHAQLVDSAYGYMPLMIGNMWEYNYQSLFPNTHLYYFTETVIGDSVAANGLKYFIIHHQILGDSSSFNYLERVDSVTANVYTYPETLQDSLRSKPGDHFNAGLGLCLAQNTKSVLGVLTTVKSFSFGGLASSEFAYGFGKDLGVTFNDGNTQEAELIYTRIAGKEYGTLLSVPSTTSEPIDFSLSQNFPNPFNPSTTIEFSMPSMQYISLEVNNVLGQRITTLIAKIISSGSHRITFDGTLLPAGIYYCTLRTVNRSITKPMLLIK